MMTSVTQLTDDLSVEIGSLVQRFVARWLPADPSITPEEFQHDVKAFCVLAHAAFEEFVEELSMVALVAARDAWSNKKFSYGTIALLCRYRAEVSVEEDDAKDQARLFDQVRKALEDSVKRHGNVITNNHGFSRPYLRSLFTPVGVDVPEDAELLQSLKELSEARGSFAHSRSASAHYGPRLRAKRPMTPERAAFVVETCLALCGELGQRVASHLDSPEPLTEPRFGASPSERQQRPSNASEVGDGCAAEPAIDIPSEGVRE